MREGKKEPCGHGLEWNHHHGDMIPWERERRNETEREREGGGEGKGKTKGEGSEEGGGKREAMCT